MEQDGVRLIAQGSAAFGADLKSATNAVNSFGASTSKAADLVQDAAGRWRTASGRFASDAEKAAAGVATVAPAAKKAGDAAEQAGRDAEKAGHGFNAFAEIATGALRKIGEVAVSALADAARATAKFVGDSISVAGDFEAGMKKFQAVAGAGVDTKGLEQFKDLFISLGKELPVSTSEVEQAAIEMVSGGIDPAIVAGGALRQTIQFAAASGLSLADAAKTSAKFLAGWTSSAATTAEKVDFLALSTDVLTKAAAASSTTAAELRLGLFNVQGAAQALHASFSDTTATLALLAPAFESSAQAGTALNVFMTRLVPQTKDATAILKDLGIITETNQNLFFDSQGAFLGMGNAAELLKTKMAGLTDEQKISQLHTLFGNDAMKVGNLLMQDGAAGLEGMIAKMDAANGVSATAALMQSGYNTALENAKGSVEALQITIGSALLPMLGDLLDNYIAPGVNALTDFASALFGSDEAFNRLSPTMQDVATTIGILYSDVQEIIGAFTDAGAGTADFARRIGDLASDLGLPGDLITDIVRGTQELVSWFNTAGDETSALGGAVGDLSGIWSHASDVIDDVMVAYQAIALAVLPIVTKFVDAHGTEISAFFQASYGTIIRIVNEALELYDAIVPPILHAVAGFITDHADAIETILTGAWNVISGTIEGALTLIEGIIKIALDLIHGDWSKAWTDLQTMSASFVQSIEKVIDGFLNIIAGFFDTSMADILKTWEDNWNMLLDIATSIDWSNVGYYVVTGILSGLSDNWDSLTSWVSDKIGDLVDSALSAIGAASPAKEFMPVGEYSVMGIMQGFQDMWPSLTDLVSSLGDDLIGQVADIAQTVQDSIADAFGATASIDRQKAKNLETLSKMDDGFFKTATENALRSAEDQAKAYADPAVGAKYYKMRSEQILEYQDLQKRIDAETDAEKKASLQQQQILILKAQEAEQSAFDAQYSRTQTALSDIARQMMAIISKIPINDTGVGADFMALLRQLEIFAGIYTPPPQLAGGGFAEKGSPYWVGEDGPELFWPGVNGTVMPAATSAQLANGGGQTSYSQNRTYNMPIYTNNSPGALQQSLAIAQAVLP